MKKIIAILLLTLTPLFAQEVKLIISQNRDEVIDYGIEFIRQAKQSIEFSPCLLAAKVCERYLDALEKRMYLQRALSVYLLVPNKHFEKRIAQLEKAFPAQFHVVRTTAVVNMEHDLTAVDNHVMLLVADGRYFTMGSANYDDSIPYATADIIGKSGDIGGELRQNFHNLFSLWGEYEVKQRFISKDLDSFAQSSTAKELDPYKRLYIKSFEEDPNVISVDSSNVQVILAAPQKANLITKEYCHLINQAEQQIVIGNLLFFPSDPIMNSLQAAVNRDVGATLVTSGESKSIWANRVSYLPLLYGRHFHLWEKNKVRNLQMRDVDIYESYGELYRKKVMVVDQRKVVIGSFNLGSDLSNFELIMVVDSKPLAACLLKGLEEDVSSSLAIEPNKMVEWFFDPLISYKAEFQKKFQTLM